MNVLILQPPLVQLNTAYPSGAYLSAFFKSYKDENNQQKFNNVCWYDLSIELYYRIFSRSGLLELFSLCTKKALDKADEAERNGDDATAFNLRRYISQLNPWCSWIDTITAILTTGASGTGAYEKAHQFVFSAHAPRGNRMEKYLSNLDHTLTTDDARPLASLALADLADFITAVFDSNFSLVRYAESLTVNETGFEQIEKAADAPVLKTFYEPLLGELFSESRASKDGKPNPYNMIHKDTSSRTLVCISVPFAGTFAAALATGRYIKQHFGERTIVCMGGGFINTELRETNERKLHNYCDALSYDRGYGSYKSLFDSGLKVSLYKMRQFTSDGCIPEMTSGNKKYDCFEKEQTASIVPDYSDIDFSRYPRLIDDTNAMHRLWSDGAWIKAYLAHGCYWHQCEFCDVTLDYVCGYQMTNVKNLYDKLLVTAKEKNVYGIHFVDEAAPPAALLQFAKKNIDNNCPLSYWGNIRFEKTYTRDIADYLAYSGLVGVSAGIEIATGDGLDAIHKGTDINSIVSACCAFKEAGILVHAYMIYGYWQETDQDCINSMETLRQFYEAGLLDSSFWHKFVLTRHSRVYQEWKEGKHPDLEPIEPKNAGLFAKNGLHFKGEEKSEKFGPGLEAALDAWMHGEEIDTPVQKWFDFETPAPTIPKNFIEKAIALYEKKRDAEFAAPIPHDEERVIWLGGEKIFVPAEKSSSSGKMYWIYMGEMHDDDARVPNKKLRGRGLCVLPEMKFLYED